MKLLTCLLLMAVLPVMPASAGEATGGTQLLVVNQGSRTLSFVDPVSMRVEASIELPAVPHELAVSPDDSTAYVSIYGNREVVGNSIAVIDLPSRAIARTISLGDYTRPHGLIARGGKLWVTAEASQSVLRVDAESGKIEWIGKTGRPGSHMLALDPQGRFVYTGDMGSSSISVIPTSDEAESVAIHHIRVGKGPEGLAVSPDGSQLWAAHRGGGGISVIDTSSREVIATLAPEVISARVTFTPDGKKVLLFDGPSSSVIVFDAGTREELGRVAVDGTPGGGIVSGDSKTAYVSVYGNFHVARINLESMKVEGTVETGIAPDGMALVQTHPKPISLR